MTDELKRFFGGRTALGADELQTLLLIVTHRVDTDSIWPLSNNTWAKYNDPTSDDSNLRYYLWQVLRGSAAAPIYFVPEEIRIGNKVGLFEDGGVTPFNNPALLLFEMACSPRYRLGWPIGADSLLLVSIGTGSAPAAHEGLTARKVHLIFQMKNVIRVIMNGSSTENDRLCRIMADCRHGAPIDSEFDDLQVDRSPVGPPMFTYIRYNADISREGLGDLGLGDVDPKRIAKLDAVGAVEDLHRVGAAAAGQVSLDHFEGFL